MNNEKRWLKSYPSEVKATIEIPNKTMIDFLHDAVELRGGHQALVFEDQQYSYRELLDRVNTLAKALIKLGVSKGTRVALMMNNCPDLVFSYYAVLSIGGIVVQNNPMYKERELLFQLKDSDAEIFIIEESLLNQFSRLEEQSSLKHILLACSTGESESGYMTIHEIFQNGSPEPEFTKGVLNAEKDIAVLQYTGGTTGVSKGVMLTHQNLTANVLQTKEFMGVYCQTGKERLLNVLPLFHVYGMTVSMNLCIVLQSTLYLMSRFSPEKVLKTIDQEKITMFPGTPTIYVGVNNAANVTDFNLSTIHTCISGSAPLPANVKQRFEALTGAKLVDAYGLSEASPVTHSNPVNGKRVTGSMGLPISNTDCKIIDIHDGVTELPVNQPGELLVKGPQIMKGYWNRQEETELALKDGWLYTGDIAYMDEEGYCFIVSRKKDVIIAGGYNIFPRDVEEVIFEHPAVQEVVVAGVPDDYRGETVKAYIVLKGNMSASKEDIKNFCEDKLAKYKVPRLIEFREELPKTTVGKILRRKLIEEEKIK